MLITPRTLSGFKDYMPEEALQKENLLQTCIPIFRSFGFMPIQTPHLEYAEILSKQGSEEIQKEMYRFTDHGGREVALRFDQTVPLARFVTQHKNLGMPFKRYAIGNVFRGERAQKGRYREFTQCDFDFVGSDSICADAEIVHVMDTCMQALDVGTFRITFNHRKILDGIAQMVDVAQNLPAVLRAIDKLDKIGKEGVESELHNVGLSREQIARFLDFVLLEAKGEEIGAMLADTLQKAHNPTFEQGVRELQQFYALLQALGIRANHLRLAFSIARGLGYYTGIVYETTLDSHPELGSVCSGGRYDNLTQNFATEKLSGVGASIGIDRLLAALEHRPKTQTQKTLVVAMELEYLAYCAKAAATLRAKGMVVELYPDIVRLKKALQYANTRGYDRVAIVGSDEFAQQTITFKDMQSGEQHSESIDSL